MNINSYIGLNIYWRIVSFLNKKRVDVVRRI